MKKKTSTTVIKDIHTFKMKFFPTLYKTELEEQMTTEDRVERCVRQAIKSTFGTIPTPANSLIVQHLEDLES